MELLGSQQALGKAALRQVARLHQAPMATHDVAVHWFRKGLRLHDNPALVAAATKAARVVPVFVLDPHFAREEYVGARRYQFLLESLRDLDETLRGLNSQLVIIQGKPQDVLPRLVSTVGATVLTFEADTEPYAKARDAAMCGTLRSTGVATESHASHTLHDMEHLEALCCGKPPPLAYTSFLKLFNRAGPVPPAIEAPRSLGPTIEELVSRCQSAMPDAKVGPVPSMEELGYPPATESPFPGGETAGLARLNMHLERTVWVNSFEKPKTSPTSLEPATTALSPYLKFGCLSARTFWHRLQHVYAQGAGSRSRPPVSLDGQLLWREFYYLVASQTRNYDKMVGNPICRQIPWRDPTTDAEAAEHLAAWSEGRTGYPWIDACMAQLHAQGWIHHLGRHAEG